MALSRALLKGMSLTDEQVQAIIDAHRETVDGLKDERDKYKEAAEKLPEVQKELDDLKKDTSSGDWQKKYNDEHQAFEDYKNEVAAKETTAKLQAAYKALLLDQKVGEKHIDSILKVTDFSSMKLKDDGTLESADKLTEAIKKDWSGFISTESKKGAEVETPPEGKGAEGTRTGRAAELARKRYEQLYGVKVEKGE